MELHHISMKAGGGRDDKDNCIPLCFDCHAEAGHYNSKHPKGIRYSPSELKKHRDEWYALIKNLGAEELRLSELEQPPIEVYEGQRIELEGFVWREAFPGPPNYESIVNDSKETYWMLILPRPICLFAESPEHGDTFRVDGVKKLQLLVDGSFYAENTDIVLSNVHITGKLFPSITGHHHGQALFQVEKLVRESTWRG